MPTPASSRLVSAVFASPPAESESTEGWPGLRPSATIASAARMATPAIAAGQRRRTTQVDQRVQKAPAWASRSTLWRRSRRSPMLGRRIGSRVSAARTETIGIIRPPKPIERMNGTGTTTIASRPIPTVTPLTATAWPAVFIASTTAASPVSPLGPLLAPAEDDEERVVDRHAEPDQADEELDDEGDLGDFGEQPEHREGGEDRGAGDDQRHDREPGAEDEGQHDQRAERADQGLDQEARAATAGVFAERLDAGHAQGRAADRVLRGRLLHGAERALRSCPALPGPAADRRGRSRPCRPRTRRPPPAPPAAGARRGASRGTAAATFLRRPGEGRVVASFGELPVLRRGDEDERRDHAAVAVGADDFLVGLERRPAGRVEGLGEMVVDRARGPGADDGKKDPDGDDQPAVAQHPDAVRFLMVGSRRAP